MLTFLSESTSDFVATETVGGFNSGSQKNSFDDIFTEAYNDLMVNGVDLMVDVNSLIKNKAKLGAFKNALLGELKTESEEFANGDIEQGTHGSLFEQVSDMFDNCANDFYKESTAVGQLLPIKAIDFPVLVKQQLKLATKDIMQTEVTKTPIVKKHIEQTYVVDKKSKKRWKYPQCFFTDEFKEIYNAGKGLPIKNDPVSLPLFNYGIIENLTDAAVPAFAISYMPDSVTKLTVTTGKVVAEAGAEVELPNLETLIFADGVTEIGNNAFANYTALKSVTLPETLTVIGENAFAGCVALESINLSKVEKIASKAFEDCNKLTVLDLSSLTEIGVQVFSIGVDGLNLEKAVVPSLSLMANNLPYYIKELVVLGEEINTDSLRTIQNLEKLTIGAGVIYVAADAISEGTVIKTVIVDKNNAYYRFEDNMLINANDEVVWDFND